MPKMPQAMTKRSKVLGLPVGRRRTDWRKLGAVGLGAASALASGLGALRSAVGSRGGQGGDDSGGEQDGDGE